MKKIKRTAYFKPDEEIWCCWTCGSGDIEFINFEAAPPICECENCTAVYSGEPDSVFGDPALKLLETMGKENFMKLKPHDPSRMPKLSRFTQ